LGQIPLPDFEKSSLTLLSAGGARRAVTHALVRRRPTSLCYFIARVTHSVLTDLL
jgi:hypothetical protein